MGDSDIMKQGIGNYKGLMICTRPNDKIQQIFDRPFVSRVEAKDQLGLNPAPKVQMNKPVKRIHFVLSKHKQWLEGYKRNVREKLIREDQNHLDKISRSDRLREQSINLINRRREHHLQQSSQNDQQSYKQAQHESFDNPSPYQQNQQYNHQDYNDNSIDINPEQLEKILSEPVQEQTGFKEKPRPQTSVQKQKNKREKPQWAKSGKQVEDEELEECDDLLNFASNLDYDKYINDMEVQSMVKAIKERVNEIKTNPSVIDSQVIVDKENQSQKMKEYIDEVDEKRSKLRENQNQDFKSNASAKSRLTMQSIKETVEKTKVEGKEEWDKSTTMGEQKYKSNIEEKLVKHLADDILKNNKYLRGIHSNNSIKQILIGEAKKHFDDTRQKNAQLV